MKTRLFQTEIVLRSGIQTVFNFFSDASNLNRITPHWLDFSIQTPMPVEMKEGAILDYRLKIRQVPLLWQSKITMWQPPERFVDVQIKGPYRMWVHHHEFQTVKEGTLVRDVVEYAVPGGVLEPFINRLFVYPDIRRIFAYRTSRLAQIFSSTPSKEPQQFQDYT